MGLRIERYRTMQTRKNLAGRTRTNEFETHRSHILDTTRERWQRYNFAFMLRPIQIAVVVTILVAAVAGHLLARLKPCPDVNHS
jgi:hypothetical protein